MKKVVIEIHNNMIIVKGIKNRLMGKDYFEEYIRPNLQGYEIVEVIK